MLELPPTLFGVSARARSLFDDVRLVVLSLLCAALYAAGSEAQSASLPAADRSDHLLGDLLGVREALGAHGLSFELFTTVDYGANVSGGAARGDTVLFNFDLITELDTAAAGLWAEGRLFLYLLADTGAPLSALSGEIQTASNIEAPESIKLYEGWYEHSFADGKLSALAGLHDYNSEFVVLETALPLLQSSFGIQGEIAQVGPSIFPTTALAVRIEAQPAEGTYLLGALYDGVPGEPGKTKGTRIHLGGDDGLFWAAEGGVARNEVDQFYKLGLGGWIHTAKVTDLSGEQETRNRGVYLIGEHQLFRESDHTPPEAGTSGSKKAQGLNGFLQLGAAKEETNLISEYYGAGVSYTGLFAGRDQDALTFGIAHARISSDARKADESRAGAETVVELNYRAPITGYLAVTPDIQWIINPGGSKDPDDALVLLLRTELTL